MAQLLSLAQIRLNAQAFAADWVGVDSERAESQSFWNDLLTVFGVSRRRKGVLFERSARRASTGHSGRIDVFWPGLMLAEQKSAGKLRERRGSHELQTVTRLEAGRGSSDMTSSESLSWRRPPSPEASASLH